MLIFIDPGHGGDDPGRLGHKHLYEADVNWSVAVALAALLNDRGMETFFTREQGETVTAGKRAQRVNLHEGDSVFVSVHCNGHWDGAPKGFEVWHFPGSLQGERLARCVLESMESSIPRPSRGLKPQSDEDIHRAKKLSVLANTKMPAALAEMEFLSNMDGLQFLDGGANQVRLAAAIASGVEKWVQEVLKCKHRRSSGPS